MNAGLQDCNVCNLGAQIDCNLVHPNTVASLLSRTPKGPLGHACGIHSGTNFGIHSGPIWDPPHLGSIWDPFWTQIWSILAWILTEIDRPEGPLNTML